MMRGRIRTATARWLLAVLATSILLVTPSIDQHAAPRSRVDRRNILFILVDDLGAHDGAPFGSSFYDTPNLTRLARRGMTFTQAYSSAAVCSPTRAAILTGLAPARLHLTDWIPGEGQFPRGRMRVPDWQQDLPLTCTTVAEVLRAAGYLTASVGKWHLGGQGSLPTDHGFEVAVGGNHIGHPASFHWPYGAVGASHRVPHLAESGGAPGEYLTDRLTDEAIRVIERADREDRPFFVQLCHYAVHAPLEATVADERRAEAATPAGGQANRRYHAMVSAVDRSVGRLLDRLERGGILARTVVVFTSDNGGAVHFGTPPATSNLPQRMGKGWAYEGGVRVPLIVSAPGVTPAASQCAIPVISHDHAPTLVGLAGVPWPGADTALDPSWGTGPTLDGRSMIPALAGGASPIHDHLCWHYPHYWNGGRVAPSSALRQGRWKLIRFDDPGRIELYDLEADPGEQRDLAASEPQRCAELTATLDAWLDGVGAQRATAKASAPHPR